MTTPEPRPNVTALPGLADEDTAQLTGNEEFLSTEDGLTLSPSAVHVHDAETVVLDDASGAPAGF